jgi:hypothetical protein
MAKMKMAMPIASMIAAQRAPMIAAGSRAKDKRKRSIVNQYHKTITGLDEEEDSELPVSFPLAS